MKKTLFIIFALLPTLIPYSVHASCNFPESNPTAGSGLSATTISSSEIDLSWSASFFVNTPGQYQIYVDDSLFTTVSGTTYAHTGLTPSTLYSYKITPLDSCGNLGAPSSTRTATTLTALSNYSFVQTSGIVTIISGTVLIN